MRLCQQEFSALLCSGGRTSDQVQLGALPVEACAAAEAETLIGRRLLRCARNDRIIQTAVIARSGATKQSPSIRTQSARLGLRAGLVEPSLVQIRHVAGRCNIASREPRVTASAATP